MVRKEEHSKGSLTRDFILGGQDGLVNVLGVILGIAAATNSFKIIMAGAFAAAFAESVSMAAVAYTSFKAEHDFYKSEENREKKEMKEVPETEKEEIRTIYKKLGFTGTFLNKIVNHIVSNKKRWLNVMMSQELKLSKSKETPAFTALIVGLSALAGSFVPILPFFVLSVKSAIIPTLLISTIALFFVGFYKAKSTIGSPMKSGIEMAAIGMLAALIGYGSGAILSALVG